MERGRGRIRSVPSGAAGGAGAADIRVPPHDLDAERAVIGAMLVSEPAVAVISETLEAEDFYSETHRVLYGAMMRLALDRGSEEVLEYCEGEGICFIP